VVLAHLFAQLALSAKVTSMKSILMFALAAVLALKHVLTAQSKKANLI